MAFRTETKTCAGLMMAVALASSGWAQTGTYEVRHRHLHGGAAGVLRVDANSIAFEERGKPAKHSRVWKYEEIQELVLAPETLRVVTYENDRWEPGGERVWVFDRLPAAVAAEWYPVLSKKLDQRFVAALADESVKPEWSVPVRLAHLHSGSQGVLLVGSGLVVYKSAQVGESRTWRITDLQNVSSANSFDLTIATREKDFRFELKQRLNEGRFDELWRRINEINGLQILKAAGEK
jgi:hypothetical protein